MRPISTRLCQGFIARPDGVWAWWWRSIKAHGFLRVQVFPHCTAVKSNIRFRYKKYRSSVEMHICHHWLTRHVSLNTPITHCYSFPRIRKPPEYLDIHCVIIKRNGRVISSRRLQQTNGYLEKTWAGTFISPASNVWPVRRFRISGNNVFPMYLMAYLLRDI